MYFKKIIGSFVYLSPVSIEDTEKWTEWLNDLSIAIPLGDEASATPDARYKMEFNFYPPLSVRLGMKVGF